MFTCLYRLFSSSANIGPRFATCSMKEYLQASLSRHSVLFGSESKRRLVVKMRLFRRMASSSTGNSSRIGVVMLQKLRLGLGLLTTSTCPPVFILMGDEKGGAFHGIVSPHRTMEVFRKGTTRRGYPSTSTTKLGSTVLIPTRGSS